MVQFENNHLKEMCSGSEAGSYLRLLDVVSLNSRLDSYAEEEGGEGSGLPKGAKVLHRGS